MRNAAVVPGAPDGVRLGVRRGVHRARGPVTVFRYPLTDVGWLYAPGRTYRGLADSHARVNAIAERAGDKPLAGYRTGSGGGHCRGPLSHIHQI